MARSPNLKIIKEITYISFRWVWVLSENHLLNLWANLSTNSLRDTYWATRCLGSVGAVSSLAHHRWLGSDISP